MAEPKTRIEVAETNPSGIPGKITLNEDVVAAIARKAAKDVPGVFSVGKTPWIALGGEATRGVTAEVGQKQAAFDLDVVVEYGVDIRKVAKELRERTAVEVSKMAGREVVEINIHVVDIHIETEEKAPPRSRVI